jgi:hypothetical protein
MSSMTDELAECLVGEGCGTSSYDSRPSAGSLRRVIRSSANVMVDQFFASSLTHLWLFFRGAILSSEGEREGEALRLRG